MLSARIELRGEELFCADTGEGGASSIRPLSPETLARLRGWAERYDKAVRSRAEPSLVEIGRDIADFLDEGDHWLHRVLAGTGEISFEIAVPGRPEERERILLDIPWELLAPNGTFLAADQERLFRVARRLGGSGTPAAPAYRDLALLFMAAEIEGQGVLNYEQEEAAILRATKNLALNLSVEESGAAEFLGQRIAQDGPFEAVHLSCHGEIVKNDPVLALEKPEGGLDLVGTAALISALGEEGKKPELVFLSACRTGEHGGAASSFVQSLVRSGVANAVGWDGSVFNDDATAFAESFHKELAAGRSVAYAAARARGTLLRAHLADVRRAQHWHLARVYAGPCGGGALCAPGRPRRPFRRDAGYREFLDIRQRRVPVASAAEFVGRRRQAQRILRAFRDPEGAGVLIHGVGSQGKSSLAARIANRMSGHEPVVIFERYDALAIFEALRNALPPRLQADADSTWSAQVTRDPSALRNALVEMLEGSFRSVDAEKRTKPVLLIVDDLERVLETPKPGETKTPVKAAYSVPLAAVIAAFRDADTESRLLFTSRYTFVLSDGRGDDLAARLVDVSLPPMDETQRDKQMRAAARLTIAEPAVGGAAGDVRDELEPRIKHAAGGNPGLQAMLSRLMLGGEIEPAERAVSAVERYLASGEMPKEATAAAEFFEQVSLTGFKDMLTADETQQLRAATLFSLPVPREILAAAGKAASVSQPSRAIDRLQGLGLVDLYLTPGGIEEAAVNPLVRPLVRVLNELESARLAEVVISPLYVLWKDTEGGLPADPRALEVARLALLADATPEIVNAAVGAGAFYLFDRRFDARKALDLVLAALAALDRAGADPDLHMLRHGADCAERLGEGEIQDLLLGRGLAIQNADPAARAKLLFTKASRLIQTGQIDVAENLLRETAATFALLGDARERAITMGKIADILQDRGQLDAALKIRTEDQLPVYEGLGDARERAVTMGKIADILQAVGQLDAALRIRTEDQLPIYRQLGDVRERAVTTGKIAYILEAKGQLDEALLMHSERLPIAEAMNDVDSIAHIKFNRARIRLRRGDWQRGETQLIFDDLGQAFAIVRKIGRADGVARIGTRFGEVLAWAGRPDEALTVLDQAAHAYETLQRSADVGQVRALQEQIRALRVAASVEPNGSGIRDDSPPAFPEVEPAVSMNRFFSPEPTSRGIAGEPAAATHPEPAPDKAEYVVWYGTNRRPNDPGDPRKGYSATRDIPGVVRYGACRVFIPKSHKIGSTGSPWWKRLLTLTDDRLRMLSVSELQREAYWSAVTAQLSAIGLADRSALIFVHGYNVSFEATALRAAQIGVDLSVKGAMAFFSWPSQGSLDGYSADEATIEASEGAIADFMTDFAERSGAGAVHIIAHSMGNRGVLRAVNRIAAAAQQRSGKPFGQIILAAADVDADVFRQLSKAYPAVSSRTTLYVSKRDLAVEASRWMHSFPRAGLMPPTLVLPGIDTVNVTDVDLTMLGHGYVAEARSVLADMHALITNGVPPDQRFGVRPTVTEQGERFWLIGG